MDDGAASSEPGNRGAASSEPKIERRTSPVRAATGTGDPPTPPGGADREAERRRRGDPPTPPGGADPEAERRRRGSSKRRAKFAVGGFVVLFTVAGLVMWAMTRPGATSFYMTVTEVAAGPPAATAESFRVNGNVVPDTLARDGIETQFDITDGKTDLTIVTSDALPDAFWTAYEHDASAVEVVAQGHLNPDGSVFDASKVLAKCPSKFKTQT